MQPERIGPYAITEQIGRGGMGAVYKARDERLQRWVAIKCVEPGKELSPERRARLQREARAVAGLVHSAVAQVYDIIIGDERDYIVMEYVEGHSLAHRLLDGPLPVSETLLFAREIADGLQAAHSKGVIHRDLKAENIMITSSGQAKILDFGLAKRFETDDPEESLTEDGMVMGTTRAMSPEQAEGKDLDHRSDLFSLGSLLYEMVTGRHPFQASSPLETMQRVVRHRPTSVRTLRSGIPEQLELIIEHLLEKDRDNRPTDANQLALALEALSDKLALPQNDSDALRSLTNRAKARRIQRRWWIVGAVLVLLGAVIVVLTLW